MAHPINNTQPHTHIYHNDTKDDQHYNDVLSLEPTRVKVTRAVSLKDDMYSDTDSDKSDEETLFDKKKAKKQNIEKLYQQYEKYKQFNIPDMYQVMGEAGHKMDKHYILAHSNNWRSTYSVALSILGKKQYTGLLEIQKPLSTPSGRVRSSSNSTGGTDFLPPLTTSQSRHSELHNSPLVRNKIRSLSTDSPSVNDGSDDDISISSSVDTTARNYLNEQSRSKKLQAKELKKLRATERKEFLTKFSCPIEPIISGTSLPKKYGATTNKINEATAALRRIGKALESFSKDERRQLIERGKVELLEMTNLRTRLQMFLNISVSARETEVLFKKFDPNNMGSVNIADVYGNAMSITKKRKKFKLGGSSMLLTKGGRSGTGRRSRIGSGASSTGDKELESSNSDIDIHTKSSNNRQSFRDGSRDVVITTALDEKIDPVGQLDGNIRCKVLLTKHHEMDDKAAEEVEDDIVFPGGGDSTIDLSQTVRSDIHNEGSVSDDFEGFFDQSVPELGMSSTMNVREFNSLEESDSVSNIFLCSIDEDIQEGDEDDGDDSQQCLVKEGMDKSSNNACTDGSVTGAGVDMNYGDDSFEECSVTDIVDENA